MPRCRACNKILSDFESTRKVAGTSEYIDLCNRCFASSGLTSLLPITERADLRTEGDDISTYYDEEMEGWDEEQ